MTLDDAKKLIETMINARGCESCVSSAWCNTPKFPWASRLVERSDQRRLRSRLLSIVLICQMALSMPGVTCSG